MTKLKTGRELRAEADALLSTVGKHVKAAAKKKPAVAAKPANRAERLRAAEASVRTAAKSEPVARLANRSARPSHAEVAAEKQKAIAVAVAVRQRFNDLRR